MTPPNREALGVLLFTAALLVIGVLSARAIGAELPATCSGGPPCTRWAVTLPEGWRGEPVVVLRDVWDAERADEGELLVNGTPAAALFGGLARPEHDGELAPRLSYETLPAPWRAGENVLEVRWATNQSPSVHEVRGAVTVLVTDPPEPAGCWLAVRPPTADYWFTRVIRGCSDGEGGRTTDVAVLSRRQVLDGFALAGLVFRNAPVERRPWPRLPFAPTTDACDLYLAWGEGSGAACPQE